MRFGKTFDWKMETPCAGPGLTPLSWSQFNSGCGGGNGGSGKSAKKTAYDSGMAGKRGKIYRFREKSGSIQTGP